MVTAAALQHVYFVRAETLGLVKIGRATDIRKRLRSLQSGSPDKLSLVGVWPTSNPAHFEAVLHSMFAARRVRGEWFWPDDDMRRFMRDCLFDADEIGVRIEREADMPADANTVRVDWEPGDSERKIATRIQQGRSLVAMLHPR
jgi:hypothetical protein